MVWEAHSTRGSCRPHEAARHKSLFFPSSLTPHSLKNHPLGSPAPGPATPAASSWVSSQTKPDSGLQGQWLEGSAMEMNFDPNCEASTPYLLFKANPFRRVNITPLFNPHLPPTFQALTFDPPNCQLYTPVLLRLSLAHPLPSVTSSPENRALPGRSDHRCHPRPTTAPN